MKFNNLIKSISSLHISLQNNAAKSINKFLTVRNYITGYYLIEYEQHGSDRAKYGAALIDKIATELAKQKIKGMTAPELSRFRQFYLTYPQILGTVSQKSILNKIPQNILGTASQKSIQLKKSEQELVIPGETLLDSLSFSHFVELIKINELAKRAYYEMITIKNSLSVRELKRQIKSLSYERTGLSEKKKLSLKTIAEKIIPKSPVDAVKNTYVFEFLEFPGIDAVQESDLEQSLLNHLQEFIMEMGNGFCFEARQKRILIGDEYFFIDLVFYHRILKRHILIELKVEEFTHANIGQLQTYLNYYKSEIKLPEEDPPIGILMVTDKNDALIKYATADSKNELFVSKYKLQLPSKKELKQFIKNELKELIL